MNPSRTFIFLAGLHRSGTSLLHEIIRKHPEVSGFSGTGVPEDEGQHLQSVYEPAQTFGGPGKFAFDDGSYMDENHPLATREGAKVLFEQWSNYYDSSSSYLVEKSPPNLIRTRYLQEMYPESKFVVILRHPLAVAYATKKWTKWSSIKSLVEHSLLAYEIFLNDMESLDSVFTLRYEEFVVAPQKTVDEIFHFLDLDSIPVEHTVRPDVNEKYFDMWKGERGKLHNRMFFRVTPELEARSNRLGYSIRDYQALLPISYLGPHKKTMTAD